MAAGCATIPDSGVSTSVGPISDQWTIQWNDVLGTPATMTNRSLQDIVLSRGTPAISDSAARAAVQAVLRDNAHWFRLREGVNDLQVVTSHASEWMRIVRLQQRYRGVPVAGGGYEARVFPNGRVGSLEGRFEPDLDLSVNPGLGEQQAESYAQGLFVGGVIRDDVPTMRLDLERVLAGPRALAIIRSGERPVLVWAITVEPRPRERWRIFIDAQNGATVGRQLVSSAY